MKALFLLAACLALSSCKPSEAEVLERNYEEAQKRGLESCADARNLAAAYAREGQQKKYDQWKLSADMQCMHESAAH